MSTMLISKPTLLLDKNKCKKNIRLMAEKTKKHKLIFRPHFKTHQSAEIGEWFREAGVSKITVSSVTMAMYFVNHGWKDILIAFPVNIREIGQINNLSKKVTLSLTIESVFTANYLEDKLTNEAGVYIKIDTGYHRTGILPDDFMEIREILDIIKKSGKLKFIGFLSHAGHTYNAKNKEEIIKIHYSSILQLNILKSEFIGDFPELIISIGDTPSSSLATDFTGVDEIRPGNFVFYDLMQYYLGSCAIKNIAVALACPVVAKHQERNEIVIYGGAVHLSKEYIVDKTNPKLFGHVVKLSENIWDTPLLGTYLSNLSQEHGIIKTTGRFFNDINIGDVIGILPVHSCLTANLSKEYIANNGKTIAKM